MKKGDGEEEETKKNNKKNYGMEEAWEDGRGLRRGRKEK